MSATIEATQRCPRCGNENRGDSYVCSFCGKRLRIEKIENFFLFKRYEAEEWVTPDPWYMKIYYLFVNPSRAFWDINHKRDKAPGYMILLFSSLLYGLMGLAYFSHFRFVTYHGEPIGYWELFPYYMSIFLLFFFFGLIFQMVYFTILIFLFSKGANYAVDFSERLESRFGEDSEEEEEKYKHAETSPFSIYKGGTLLQKQKAHRRKMLMCAFTPFLLINGIKCLIILIALPSYDIDISGRIDAETYSKFFNSPVWAVLDVMDAITIAIWVPILMTIGIRELSNSSTFRVLISCIIIGVLVAIFFYFLRPTLFGVRPTVT